MRALPLLAMTALVNAALAGCLSYDDGDPDVADSPAPVSTGGLPDDPVPLTDANRVPGLSFIAIGDQGTGGEEQLAVAATAKRACDTFGCDFAVALGDNLYEIGAGSVNDPQFDNKFEIPYAAFDIPFYLVQGNHDNSCDPISCAFPGLVELGVGHWYQTGNHEVAYTYRDDRASDKWHMPDRFYTASLGSGELDLFALDTNLLMFWGFGASTDVPEDIPTYGEQAAWMDEAVAASTAPWRIAIGHHPYLSNGAHGNAGAYDGGLPPLSGPYVQTFYEDHVCGNVDIILAGHDHDLQWLEPQSQCGLTQQMVSGAAAKMRSVDDANRNPAFFQQYDTHGFLWANIDGDTFTGRFYDVDGTLLYEGTITKP